MDFVKRLLRITWPTWHPNPKSMIQPHINHSFWDENDGH